MINNPVSKRISELIKLIPEGKSVADIGTDHGILPIALAKADRYGEIIATDISSESLEKLIIKLNENPYNIQTIVSDGLKALVEPYPEVVVISGMGSRLIIKILEESKEIAENIEIFIFQPNTTVDELRVYLHNNGFSIKDERCVYENNRHYSIIVAVHGNEKYEMDCHYKYGKILLENQNPNLKSLLESEKLRFTRLLNTIDTDANARINEIKKELEIIQEALNYYEIT